MNRHESQTNNESEPPFSNAEVIYEDYKVKIVAERKHFVRQQKFKFDDLLINVKVQAKRWRKKSKPAVILTILESLFRALVKIIDVLRERYGDNNHRQLYATVIDKNIDHGINTGKYKSFN